MTSVMTVYDIDRRTALGHLQDFGAGRILADVRKPDGKFVSLGFFPDRKAGREAIKAAAAGEAPKPGGPPPPEAA